MILGVLLAAAEAETESGGVTFGKAWAYGGFLMWVLALLSTLALAVMIYLWLSQRPKYFLPEALSRLSAAKDPAAEGARLADRVNSAVDWLADIATVAPLVGLLGTVLGIFDAFSVIDDFSKSPDEKNKLLTFGVSKAVVTTIFGLVVSIPSLVAHAIFRRRAAALLASLEEQAERGAAVPLTGEAPANDNVPHRAEPAAVTPHALASTLSNAPQKGGLNAVRL